jgi:hypothetical protein
MRILTDDDVPNFVHDISKLQHPRSLAVAAHIGLTMSELYTGYADYREMLPGLRTEPHTVAVTLEELAVMVYIFGCATIVYSELSVRERIIVPLPLYTVVPLLVDGEPDSIEGIVTGTIHRNGVSAEYFAACAENSYGVYRAYAEA